MSRSPRGLIPHSGLHPDYYLGSERHEIVRQVYDTELTAAA